MILLYLNCIRVPSPLPFTCSQHYANFNLYLSHTKLDELAFKRIIRIAFLLHISTVLFTELYISEPITEAVARWFKNCFFTQQNKAIFNVSYIFWRFIIRQAEEINVTNIIHLWQNILTVTPRALRPTLSCLPLISH